MSNWLRAPGCLAFGMLRKAADGCGSGRRGCWTLALQEYGGSTPSMTNVKKATFQNTSPSYWFIYESLVSWYDPYGTIAEGLDWRVCCLRGSYWLKIDGQMFGFFLVGFVLWRLPIRLPRCLSYPLDSI